ncbi:MAG: prepilin peptidase [Patescibacteria group bacterium]
MLLIALLVFFGGLFIGSFLNVIADRLQRHESFLLGRSHCDHCKKELSWYELIPVVSYLLQQGKCRHCHHHLSRFYPLSELIAGLMLSLVTLSFISQPLEVLFLLLFISCCLLIIVFSDLKYEIIPFPVVAVVTIASLILLVITSPTLLPLAILSGFGVAFFFFAIFFLTKGRGMGFGDVIYAFCMGVLLGFPKIILGIYIAFITGAIVALGLVLLKKKKLHGGTIPFGPFLVLGTFTMIMWGDKLMNVALKLLLGRP